MQEHVAPPLVPPTTEGSLADLPTRNAATNPTRIAFSRREGTAWVDVTAAEFADDVRGVAKGLVAAGVKPGDRVAIMCKTRYEWTLTDFAIWTAGAVTVPIYETSSAHQVEWILNDSGATGILLETAAHEATLGEVRDQLPGLKHVWQVDAGGIEELKAAGASVGDDELAAATAGTDRRSIATIIYTSGTTGRPKGCPAHARQLPGPGRERHHQARARSSRPTAPRRCSSCRWPTSSRGSSRSSASRARPRWATAPTSRTCSATSPSSSRRSSSPSPGSSRRSSTPPRPRPPGRARARSSPPRPTRPSPGRAPRTPVARAWACACGTACSTGSSTASSARPWAARSCMPCPAARRSAPAWATSSAASA